MNARRLALICASAVATATLLTGCNGDNTDNTTTGGANVSTPAQSTPSAKSTDDSDDKALLDEIAPCDLLSDGDMNMLFSTGSFGHEGGGFVEDFHGRHCVFTGSDARIDDDGRYSLADVSIDVLVQLDDTNGTKWQAMKDASPKSTVAITGVDEALKVGDGWIQAKRGRVIITVQDNSQEIKDNDAVRVIHTAFTNLSGHHG